MQDVILLRPGVEKLGWVVVVVGRGNASNRTSAEKTIYI